MLYECKIQVFTQYIKRKSKITILFIQIIGENIMKKYNPNETEFFNKMVSKKEVKKVCRINSATVEVTYTEQKPRIIRYYDSLLRHNLQRALNNRAICTRKKFA